MDLDSDVEKGEIPSTVDGDPLSSAQDGSSEHGTGIAHITDMPRLRNMIFTSGYWNERVGEKPCEAISLDWWFNCVCSTHGRVFHPPVYRARPSS